MAATGWRGGRKREDVGQRIQRWVIMKSRVLTT